MSYLFLSVLVVFVLACAMMAEAFWSSLHNEESLSHSLFRSLAAGSGFVIYAVIDYLLVVPGTSFLAA